MTEFIAANMHYGMTLLDINTCKTEEGRLTSMQWTFADDLGEEKVYLPRLGPRLTNCNTDILEFRNEI